MGQEKEQGKEVGDPNKITVEALRSPSWESSLVYGTLVRMRDEGIDVDAVYAATTETKVIDLRVVINGYEFPAMAFIERWRREFEYQVAKEARRLVAENPELNQALERIHETLSVVDQSLCDMTREVFPHADLDRE